MSEEQARRDRQHIATLERFYRVIQGDLELLDEVVAPDFRLVEPDNPSFPEPIRNAEQFRAHVAKRTQVGSTFEAVAIDPVAGALVVDLDYTPPGGGATQRWKCVYGFWDGKVSRVDAKRVD